MQHCIRSPMCTVCCCVLCYYPPNSKCFRFVFSWVSLVASSSFCCLQPSARRESVLCKSPNLITSSPFLVLCGKGTRLPASWLSGSIAHFKNPDSTQSFLSSPWNLWSRGKWYFSRISEEWHCEKVRLPVKQNRKGMKKERNVCRAENLGHRSRHVWSHSPEICLIQ